jgi:hypothetical protein
MVSMLQRWHCLRRFFSARVLLVFIFQGFGALCGQPFRPRTEGYEENCDVKCVVIGCSKPFLFLPWAAQSCNPKCFVLGRIFLWQLPCCIGSMTASGNDSNCRVAFRRLLENRLDPALTRATSSQMFVSLKMPTTPSNQITPCDTTLLRRTQTRYAIVVACDVDVNRWSHARRFGCFFFSVGSSTPGQRLQHIGADVSHNHKYAIAVQDWPMETAV